MLEQTVDFEWLDHSLFSSSPVMHELISKHYWPQYNPEKSIFIKNSLNYWGLRNTVLRNPLTNSNNKSREIIFHFFLYFLHIYQLPWIIFIFFPFCILGHFSSLSSILWLDIHISVLLFSVWNLDFNTVIIFLVSF